MPWLESAFGDSFRRNPYMVSSQSVVLWLNFGASMVLQAPPSAGEIASEEGNHILLHQLRHLQLVEAQAVGIGAIHGAWQPFQVAAEAALILTPWTGTGTGNPEKNTTKGLPWFDPRPRRVDPVHRA